MQLLVHNVIFNEQNTALLSIGGQLWDIAPFFWFQKARYLGSC